MESNKSGKIGCLGVIIIIILGYWGGKALFPVGWTAFYYPYGSASSSEDFIISDIDRFKSLESCLNWIEDLRYQNRENSDIDEWECGSNCKMTGFKIYQCKDTVDAF